MSKTTSEWDDVDAELRGGGRGGIHGPDLEGKRGREMFWRKESEAKEERRKGEGERGGGEDGVREKRMDMKKGGKCECRKGRVVKITKGETKKRVKMRTRVNRE